jgi:hypothetical protein
LTVEHLFRKINDLSTKVEKLLESENESECTSLLIQRHALLEELAANVSKLTDVNPSSEILSRYYDFLKSIQKRDTSSIEFALMQREEIFVKRRNQEKGKKAIKVYKKLTL